MVLKSVRENEPRATSLGYRTDDYKLVAFILSAGAGRRRRAG
jgi:branched-chain amino acid transport system permease protein